MPFIPLPRRLLLVGQLLLILQASASWPVHGQKKLPLSKYRGQEMLGTIKNDLKTNYYDPDFHGIDLENRFKVAHEKIESATSNGGIYAIIAQVLSELNDSHTSFLPPSWRLEVDYGFQMQTIGDECYVTSVNPESDAGKQGLKAGDLIVSIDGFAPSRNNLWKIRYSYFVLQPRDGMTLDIRSVDGQTKTLKLKMQLIYDYKLQRDEKKAELLFHPRYYEANSEVIICKFPHFNFEDKEIDEVATKIGQRKSIILDLRGNHGGLQDAMQRFIGYLFDHEIRIGEEKERSKTRQLVSQPRGAKTVSGKLIILVDSSSASAAEIFARTMQLQKRGVVIGDRTAGDVMAAKVFVHRFNRSIADEWYFSLGYGASITVGDFLMPGGRSLEHVGVTPDELILPTPTDLAQRRDPLLSLAVEMAGGHLDPVQAGSLFPALNH